VNLKYLGDALDHWKGSLFEYLSNVGVLRDFAVDPMASDLLRWTKADYSLFARLLRINEDQLVRHQVTLRNRSGYFNEIPQKGDLFLDPDTGIATGRVNQKYQYIMPREVAMLIPESNDRLLAIYQHVRAKKVSVRVNECLDKLKKDIGSFGWCSYESGTVAMIFISRRPSRTKDVAVALKTLLGRHAVKRVRAGVRK
jgi:hypothetical protein